MISPNNHREDRELIIKILFFVCLVLGIFTWITWITKTASAFEGGGGFDINEMGYYCPPYSASINDGDFVVFNSGVNSCHYILDGAPAGGYYGDIYIGTIGNATIIGGHSLGAPCDDGICDSIQSDDWIVPSRYQGEDIFIAIFQYSSACREYFQTGAGSCGNPYGIYELKWYEVFENEINFTSPVGQQTENAPFLLNWQGDYKIASSSIYWNTIEVELTHYTPPDYATSTTDGYFIAIDAQNKGIGSFNDTGHLVIDGTYVYRARLAWSIYDYMATTSDWIYKNEVYWQFEVGEPDGGLPGMEDYFATTSDFGIMGNMFRDVLLWLFKPNAKVLDYWKTIKGIVEEKPPFGYYVLVKENFDNLSAGETPAFELETAPAVLEHILVPLKNGLVWILWILFGVWFVRRFIHFVV